VTGCEFPRQKLLPRTQDSQRGNFGACHHFSSNDQVSPPPWDVSNQLPKFFSGPPPITYTRPPRPHHTLTPKLSSGTYKVRPSPRTTAKLVTHRKKTCVTKPNRPSQLSQSKSTYEMRHSTHKNHQMRHQPSTRAQRDTPTRLPHTVCAPHFEVRDNGTNTSKERNG
jgi:hypothetical protein